VASSVSLDMVEVASSNLAGPTNYKKARVKRAFLRSSFCNLLRNWLTYKSRGIVPFDQ